MKNKTLALCFSIILIGSCSLEHQPQTRFHITAEIEQSSLIEPHTACEVEIDFSSYLREMNYPGAEPRGIRRG